MSDSIWCIVFITNGTRLGEDNRLGICKKALLHLPPGTKEDSTSCRAFSQYMRRRDLPDPSWW